MLFVFADERASSENVQVFFLGFHKILETAAFYLFWDTA